MSDTPNVLEQVPAGGGMNKPSSGTYGEKADLDRLRQQLPSADPAAGPSRPQPGAGAPAGRPQPGPRQVAALPPGLSEPTQRPDVPASTPLSSPPVESAPLAGAEGVGRYIQILEALSKTATSAETREWAEVTLQKLQGN